MQGTDNLLEAAHLRPSETIGASVLLSGTGEQNCDRQFQDGRSILGSSLTWGLEHLKLEG